MGSGDRRNTFGGGVVYDDADLYGASAARMDELSAGVLARFSPRPLLPVIPLGLTLPSRG
jgi:hypothetical protein